MFVLRIIYANTVALQSLGLRFWYGFLSAKLSETFEKQAPGVLTVRIKKKKQNEGKMQTVDLLSVTVC